MSKVQILYFSGSGQGAQLAKKIEKELCNYEVSITDITGWKERDDYNNSISSEQMILIFPVYASEAPHMLIEFLSKLYTENKTKVMVMALWGNAHNGNALKHVIHILDERGFYINAAAELVTKHTYLERTYPIVFQFDESVYSYVKDRLFSDKRVLDIPERKDPLPQRILCSFKQGSVPKLITSIELDTKSCISCGKCIGHCPTHAIEEHTYAINEKKCIRCTACVTTCPVKARKLKVNAIGCKALQQHMKIQKENVFY